MAQNQAVVLESKKEKALSDVTLNIPQGEIFCIMGSSGSGKSTLLKILGGLKSQLPELSISRDLTWRERAERKRIGNFLSINFIRLFARMTG